MIIKVTLSLYYKFLELNSSPTTQKNACIYSIVHGAIDSIIRLQQQSRSFLFLQECLPFDFHALNTFLHSKQT